MSYELIQGDCIEVMRALPSGSVQTCITSPPYYGLRDYGTASWEGGDTECDHRKNPPAYSAKALAKSTIGAHSNTGHAQEGYGATCGKCGARRIDNQIGLEPDPESYVAKLVDVFREVRRVLRDDGTLWLNLASSYAGSGRGPTGENGIGDQELRQGFVGGKKDSEIGAKFPVVNMAGANEPFALRDDLTSDEIIYVLTELAAFRQSVEVAEPNFAISVDEAVASLACGEKV